MTSPALADPDLAQRVALRELQVGSAGIKRLKLRFDRRAWRIQPGMVMRIKAPDKGIQDMVVRVATYDDGTMIDGTIAMDALQDVFGLPSTVYTTPVDNPTTERPNAAAPPIVYQAAMEATYLDMQRGLSAADFASVGDTEGGVIAMAGRPNTLSQYPVMFATPVGGATERDAGIYAATAVSGRPLGFYDINIFVSNGVDLGDLKIGMTGVFNGVELVQVSRRSHHPAGRSSSRAAAAIPCRCSMSAVKSSSSTTLRTAYPPTAYETGDVINAQIQNVATTAQSDLASRAGSYRELSSDGISCRS